MTTNRGLPRGTTTRLLILAAVLLLIVGFFAFGLHRDLTLESLRAQREALEALLAAHPVLGPACFFTVYVVVVALSVPGATVLTLAAGALFGLWQGVLLVSFASSLGAALAFVIARYLLRDAVRRRVGERLQRIDAGIEREGPFYLATLRLVPLFPFFVVNLAMALTAIPLRTFYWVSQLAMLPGTFLYVNAGTELAGIDSVGDIASQGVLLSFAALALLPLLARWAVAVLQRRRIYARWPRPAKFDRNVVVIGAGSAGLVAAYIAATSRARVTLIERERMGGDCLNTGCVPSKALIRSARLLADMRRAPAFGIGRAEAQFDFGSVMERVQRAVASVAPHDSVERYTRLGVECLHGKATIRSPFEVEVAGDGEPTVLTTRAIVIAAGARPTIPAIPGIDEVGCVTSDTVWSLRERPSRLLVLGGGAIGCELAQAFARLGSSVTQVESSDRLLSKEDPEFSALVLARFREEGIDVRLGHTATRFILREGRKVLVARAAEGSMAEIDFDLLLCAVGRTASTSGYGLEALGIRTTDAGTLETNAFLQTIYPNVYACGDVAGPYQFTHMAAHQAWYAAINALFGRLKRFRVDHSIVPWATFTDPEVARVGLSEREATARQVPYEVTRFSLQDLDRAIADAATCGQVKVLTVPGRDRILGVTIAGERAADLIAEFVLAMKHGLGLQKILSTIHVYPTFAEAGKSVAGEWRRAHLPGLGLKLAERYNAWQLG